MPKRDRPEAEGTGAGRHVSRRAVLAGVGIALCSPSMAVAARPLLRVGLPAGLGIAPAVLAGWCGRDVVLVRYAGWGVLGDHAACGGAGLIDAAVLPAEGAGAGLPVQSPSLWRRAGTAPWRVGVAVSHPSSDAALRRLLGRDLTVVALPMGALWPNLAAGLLDAAAVPGDAPAQLPGLRSVPVAAADAAALLPRLDVMLLGGSA